MKINVLRSLLILATLAVSAVLLLSPEAQSYSTGAPSSSSGAPGDLGTCIQCHGAQTSEKPDWVTSTVPSSGFSYSTTYTFTATATHNGAAKIGFEASAETPSEQKTGTLIVTDVTRTQIVEGNFITHTLAGVTPTNNSNTWSFNWTSPSGGTPYIALYFAFCAGDGNGLATGDRLYRTIYPIFHTSTVGIDKGPGQPDCSVYPNPSAERITVSYGGDQPAFFSLTDLSGRIMMSGNVGDGGSLDVSDLTGGVYLLAIDLPRGRYTQRVIIH